jgi:uncharacterized OB-fold protein
MEVRFHPKAWAGVQNPFGAMAEATVDPFPVGDSHHLLLTLTDGRVVMAYVLIPQGENAIVDLGLKVDFGATVEGDVVKLSWRKYKDEGGFVVVSDRYRFNSATSRYEKVTS